MTFPTLPSRFKVLAEQYSWTGTPGAVATQIAGGSIRSGLAQNTPVSPRLLQVLIASPKQVPQLVVTQLRPLPAFKAEPMKHIQEQPLDLHPERRGHLLKVRILGKPGKIFLSGRSEVPPTLSRKSHHLTTYLGLCMLEHIV